MNKCIAAVVTKKTSGSFTDGIKENILNGIRSVIQYKHMECNKSYLVSDLYCLAYSHLGKVGIISLVR